MFWIFFKFLIFIWCAVQDVLTPPAAAAAKKAFLMLFWSWNVQMFSGFGQKMLPPAAC